MQPNSYGGGRLMIEYIYCDDATKVQEAIDILIARARRQADSALAFAEKIRTAAYLYPVVQHASWSPER